MRFASAVADLSPGRPAGWGCSCLPLRAILRSFVSRDSALERSVPVSRRDDSLGLGRALRVLAWHRRDCRARRLHDDRPARRRQADRADRAGGHHRRGARQRRGARRDALAALRRAAMAAPRRRPSATPPSWRCAIFLKPASRSPSTTTRARRKAPRRRWEPRSRRAPRSFWGRSSPPPWRQPLRRRARPACRWSPSPRTRTSPRRASIS